MCTVARKQVDPCFPDVHRLTSARVYHGKRIISTELDARTVSGGASATGRCPWSRPGAGQFHRYFVPIPSRTHPDGRGGVSNRRPENIMARRSKGAPHSGGHPAFFSWGIFMCRIAGFCDFNAEKLKQNLLRCGVFHRLRKVKPGCIPECSRVGVTECVDGIFGGHHWFYREDPLHHTGFPMEMFQRGLFFV